MRRGRNRTSQREPRLVLISASGPREYWLTKRKTTVGSASTNDLVLPDGGVSRRHALIVRRFGKYRLIDFESTNGTFINGRPVRSAKPIARGDELRFGGVRFVFLDPPRTRELKKRVSLRKVLALVLFSFAVGFVLTQYSITRKISERLSGAQRAIANNEEALRRQTALAEAEAAKEAAFLKEPEWLWRINYYRHMAHLPEITEDTSLSYGDFKHARYLVMRAIRTHSLIQGADAHSEDTSDPLYTPDGLRAATNSDVQQAAGEGAEFSGVAGVDAWINIPFHRLSILSPQLLSAGYGYYCESGSCAAALDAGSRIQSISPTDTRPLPVEFPPDGSSIPIGTFNGAEWPDPLASCPGYSAPTGYPITLEFDWRLVPLLRSYSVSRDGKPLEVCGFDSSNYSNPDSSTQAWARNGLKGFGAVVLIPREPLIHEATYLVTITASGQTYTWKFAVK
jgi:pSer/pThr/pTyr-binding forkhead associated (FHA) protein